MMRIKDEEKLKQYMVNAQSTREAREGECIVNLGTMNFISVQNFLCFYLYHCLGVLTI